MIKKLLNILSIALIYCGAIFGAGFASGREVFSFFSCYKTWGIAASFLSCFLFSYLGYHICREAKNKELKNIEEYLFLLFPKSLARFFSFVTTAFLVLSFCIMITGCGTLFYEQFKIPVVFAAMFSLVVCYMVIKNRVLGLERFNFFATPIMVVGVLVLCIFCFNLPKISSAVGGEMIPSVISGLLYVSYNMVSATAVLVSASKSAKTEREAAFGGMLGGLLAGVLLVLMSLILAYHWEVASYPMPFFSLIYNNFPSISLLCSLVLYLAMMTTAVSSGVSLIDNVDKKKSGKYTLMLCLFAFFVSFLPFAQLVVSVYSAFGFLGIVFIIRIFIRTIENRRNKRVNQRKIKN